MLTLYDYLPSMNAWKVRCLLAQLGLPYRTEMVAIFDGAGQEPAYRAINPTGAVPALRLDDGRTLAESNAIQAYLADGTPYFLADAFVRAKVLQWLCFEADYVQSTVATLRHWVMTGKERTRPSELIAAKRLGSAKVLGLLDAVLAKEPFLADGRYSIADIAVFAYTHRADEAGLEMAGYPSLADWFGRVRLQPGFLAESFAYSIDPHSGRELP